MKFLRLVLLVAAVAACSEKVLSPLQPGIPSPSLAGTWRASVLRSPWRGIPTFDMLEVGANLTLSVDAAGRTTGRLVAPFGSPEVDMTGQAVINGDRIRFEQAAETFVRLLEWKLAGDTLAVTDQHVATTRFTVRLVRE